MSTIPKIIKITLIAEVTSNETIVNIKDLEPAKCVTKSGQGLKPPRTEAAFPLCTATDSRCRR